MLQSQEDLCIKKYESLWQMMTDYQINEAPSKTEEDRMPKEISTRLLPAKNLCVVLITFEVWKINDVYFQSVKNPGENLCLHCNVSILLPATDSPLLRLECSLS